MIKAIARVVANMLMIFVIIAVPVALIMLAVIGTRSLICYPEQFNLFLLLFIFLATDTVATLVLFLLIVRGYISLKKQLREIREKGKEELEKKKKMEL